MSDQMKGIDTLIKRKSHLWGFTNLDNGIFYTNQVGPQEKMVYIAIYSKVNSDSAVAWPSYNTLADMTGLGRSTVIRAVKRLIELDLITKIEKAYNSNRYIINDVQESTVLGMDSELVIQKLESKMGMPIDQIIDQAEEPADPEEGSEKEENIPIADVIKYLNEKAGKKLNPATESNRKDIRARWKECRKNGMEEIEIKRLFARIIDLKVEQFTGKIFNNNKPGETYLKPMNLFNQTNFVKYSDEIDMINQGKMNGGQAPAPKFTGKQNQNQMALAHLKQKYASQGE